MNFKTLAACGLAVVATSTHLANAQPHHSDRDGYQKNTQTYHAERYEGRNEEREEREERENRHSFAARLQSSSEVPPTTDTAKGQIEVTVKSKKNQICYNLAVKGLVPTDAHIHKGAAGVNGPVVVVLDLPTTGISRGCVAADPALVKDMLKNPQNYYGNVHDAQFPKGAIRGNLARHY